MKALFGNTKAATERFYKAAIEARKEMEVYGSGSDSAAKLVEIVRKAVKRNPQALEAARVGPSQPIPQRPMGRLTAPPGLKQEALRSGELKPVEVKQIHQAVELKKLRQRKRKDRSACAP